MMSWFEIKAVFGHHHSSRHYRTVIGAIPGAGANISSFMAYERGAKTSRSKTPERYGRALLKALSPPEASNNAVSGGQP
jgi:putative tricarboxylic transport membrane protein